MFYAFKEAALPLDNSSSSIRSVARDELTKALGVTDRWSSEGPWIVEMFSDFVVYQFKGVTYKRGYKVTINAAGTPPTVKLTGDPIKVHMAFMDNKESAKESMRVYMDDMLNVTVTSQNGPIQIRESVDFDASSINVQEGSKSTTVPIKIIQAGWGASAYYPKEVIQRDGPKVYKRGVHMMWNHATESEQAERPAGDLNDFAAVLTEDAHWDEEGPKGPGLYAQAKIFSDYAEKVLEKGNHIGVSINAAIKAKEGEVEGKKGLIAESFVHAFSVDFVTKPGAGGAPIVPVTESQGAHIEEDTMTDEQVKALEAKNRELEEDNKKSKEAMRLLQEREDKRQREALGSQAYTDAAKILKEAEIPFSSAVLRRSTSNPVIKDGKYDADWFKGVVEDFSEGHDGRVTGLGGKTKAKETESAKETETRLKESLIEMGMDEKSAEIAAKGV